MIDDIEDDSQLRRGVPVVHKIYGVPQTINSANYVYFLAYEELSALRREMPDAPPPPSPPSTEDAARQQPKRLIEEKELDNIVTGECCLFRLPSAPCTFHFERAHVVCRRFQSPSDSCAHVFFPCLYASYSRAIQFHRVISARLSCPRSTSSRRNSFPACNTRRPDSVAHLARLVSRDVSFLLVHRSHRAFLCH